MQPTIARYVNIRNTVPLVSHINLVNDLPAAPKVESTVAAGRKQVGQILNGTDPRFIGFVGPCSIHDEEAALEYAERLHRCSQRLTDRLLEVMRVYFEKPRTTTGWKGLIYDPH